MQKANFEIISLNDFSKIWASIIKAEETSEKSPLYYEAIK